MLFSKSTALWGIIHKEVMSSSDTEYTLHGLSNPQAIPSEKQRFKNKRKINRN